VLCALPALLALGLLRHSRRVFSAGGYYPLETIFCRSPFGAGAVLAEALRYEAPGNGANFEVGSIPEVRTLRAKLDLLCEGSSRAAMEWESGAEWMEAAGERRHALH
jgi:hypothetical protein